MIPKKPYCTDILGERLLIRSRKAALRRRHVQVNDPWRWRFLLFDVDSGEARFAVQDAGLPQPCWTALTPNGHAHVAYQLQTPVYLQGRRKPLEYLTAVENGVRRALGGDASYSGFLTHNPLHPDFETVATGYAVELGDLAAEVDMSGPPAPEPVSGIGRNWTRSTRARVSEGSTPTGLNNPRSNSPRTAAAPGASQCVIFGTLVFGGGVFELEGLYGQMRASGASMARPYIGDVLSRLQSSRPEQRRKGK